MKAAVLFLLASVLVVSAQPADRRAPVLEEFNIQIICDDEGTLCLNGNPVLVAGNFPKVYSTKLFLKTGDILTVDVKDRDRGKDGGLLIHISKGDSAVVTAADFKYTITPTATWRLDSSLSGYKAPNVFRIDTVVLGGEAKPQQAWTVLADRTYATAYFKYVFP